jgi:hypothetical protein
MKAGTIFFICALALLLLVGSAPALAQSTRDGKAAMKQQPPPRPLPTPLSPAEGASVTGSIYRNSYFGFQLTIPKGWIVQSDATKERMKEVGKSIAVNRDAKEKAASDAAVERTINLLTVSKLPLGTIAEFNALFTCVAEPLPLASTPASYMTKLKETLLNMTVPVAIEKEGDIETIDGAQFSVLTILMSPPRGLPARQHYYVTFRKGYALGFVTTVLSESDSAAMDSIVRSARFRQRLR